MDKNKSLKDLIIGASVIAFDSLLLTTQPNTTYASTITPSQISEYVTQHKGELTSGDINKYADLVEMTRDEFKKAVKQAGQTPAQKPAEKTKQQVVNPLAKTDSVTPYVLIKPVSCKATGTSHVVLTRKQLNKILRRKMRRMETRYTMHMYRDGRVGVKIYQSGALVASHVFPNVAALNYAIAKYLR